MGMKTITAGMLALAALAAVACNDSSTAPAGPSYSATGLPEASVAAAQARGARSGFGFNGTVSGFPTGAVFRTGGGSFNAATASNVVPSETDIAPDIPGDQTLWVQGVGCGHALVHFNR